MNLKEFKEIIDFLIASQPYAGEKEVVVEAKSTTTSLGCKPSSKVKDARIGFDWEANQVRISTEDTLWLGEEDENKIRTDAMLSRLNEELLKIVEPRMSDFTGYNEETNSFDIVLAVKEIIEDLEQTISSKEVAIERLLNPEWEDEE